LLSLNAPDMRLFCLLMFQWVASLEPFCHNFFSLVIGEDLCIFGCCSSLLGLE